MKITNAFIAAAVGGILAGCGGGLEPPPEQRGLGQLDSGPRGLRLRRGDAGEARLQGAERLQGPGRLQDRQERLQGAERLQGPGRLQVGLISFVTS